MNMTKTELEQLLAEAQEAMKGVKPSKLMQKAPKMSGEELQKNIDKQLDAIVSGKLKGEKLELAKLEAQMLAIMKLRRNY
jgi:hypothetical protein